MSYISSKGYYITKLKEMGISKYENKKLENYKTHTVYKLFQKELQKATRVFAAILKGNEILMVLHEHDNKKYWTLPGGGVEKRESPEQALLREIEEETGVKGSIRTFLFQMKTNKIQNCYLVEILDESKLMVGRDPELDENNQMIKEVAWKKVDEMKGDIQVSMVMKNLKKVF